MLRRWAEPGGHQQRAELVAVQRDVSRSRRPALIAIADYFC